MSYKIGAATACITPDEPLWLAGYASRTSPARGKISDLYASALALEDNEGNRFVLASADLIAITPTIADPVAAAVQSRHRLSREQVLLTATHTHYGPEFRPDKPVFFNMPHEYAAKLPAIAERIASALIEVIDCALGALRPARLFLHGTVADFAKNRRRPPMDERSLEALVDHTVNVLECVDEAGTRRAIVFGYACHNTTIPPEDLRYCGDWAGFAKERLQRSNPGASALFLPGAGADQGPEPRGSVELSRQHGEAIARAVQKSIDSPGVELSGPIRVAWEDVALPLESVTQDTIHKMLTSEDPPQRVKGRYLLDMQERGKPLITSYSAPVQVVRFGNELLLIALPGEPVVEWAHKLKQGTGCEEQGVTRSTSRSTLCASGSPIVWVAGYCNDMFGYLPTRRVQTEGGYEGGRANLWSSIPAPFTEDVESRVAAAVSRLVERVRC